MYFQPPRTGYSRIPDFLHTNLMIVAKPLSSSGTNQTVFCTSEKRIAFAREYAGTYWFLVDRSANIKGERCFMDINIRRTTSMSGGRRHRSLSLPKER
jgi:hypothetical protein